MRAMLKTGTRSVVTMLAVTAGWLFASIGMAADTNTYIGPNSGNWSTDANWSLGHAPLETEIVNFTNGASITTYVDSNRTIAALYFSVFGETGGTITIQQSGGSTLTLGKISSSNSKYHEFYVPVVLPSNTLVETSGYGGGFRFFAPISGAYKLTAGGGKGQVMLYATNTFSGGLDITNAYTRFNNGSLGTGPVTLGLGAGSGILFYNMAGIYSNTTNTVTVQTGTGERFIYSQTAGSVTLPMNFVLNTNLAFYLLAGAQCTLSGAISGSGGIVKDFSVSTGTLAGVCTYTGATLVKQGTLTLDGTMSNVNVTIGNPSAAALINGAGTLSFQDNNLIDVNTNGTLNAAALKFDLTALTGKSAVLVDYSHLGTFTAPSPLSNILTPSSQKLFTVTDTGSQVVATRKPSGTVIAIR